MSNDGQPAQDEELDEAVVSGKRSTSDPAGADNVTINRSGSGGSGGPATPDESVEGSSGQSMSELLTGDDDSAERER
jgi:hypothetical protein